jgi:hypothetical protein
MGVKKMSLLAYGIFASVGPSVCKLYFGSNSLVLFAPPLRGPTGIGVRAPLPLHRRTCKAPLPRGW